MKKTDSKTEDSMLPVLSAGETSWSLASGLSLTLLERRGQSEPMGGQHRRW
jgi:hypothetical protein